MGAPVWLLMAQQLLGQGTINKHTSVIKRSRTSGSLWNSTLASSCKTGIFFKFSKCILKRKRAKLYYSPQNTHCWPSSAQNWATDSREESLLLALSLFKPEHNIVPLWLVDLQVIRNTIFQCKSVTLNITPLLAADVWLSQHLQNVQLGTRLITGQVWPQRVLQYKVQKNKADMTSLALTQCSSQRATSHVEGAAFPDSPVSTPSLLPFLDAPDAAYTSEMEQMCRSL